MIGCEKLTKKAKATPNSSSVSDYLPDLPSTPTKRKPVEFQDTEGSIKKFKKSDKKVKIKLSVRKGESDDVIYIKECDTDVVKLEVKIGSSADFPICITGDNAGILPSNPIIID